MELYYDRFLKGSSRSVMGERDARGRTLLYEDVEKTAVTRGLDVVLTIDKTIQHIAERALKKAVDESRAKGGTAVVMDPWDGAGLRHGQQSHIRPEPVSPFRPG